MFSRHEEHILTFPASTYKPVSLLVTNRDTFPKDQTKCEAFHVLL